MLKPLDPGNYTWPFRSGTVKTIPAQDGSVEELTLRMNLKPGAPDDSAPGSYSTLQRHLMNIR